MTNNRSRRVSDRYLDLSSLYPSIKYFSPSKAPFAFPQANRNRTSFKVSCRRVKRLPFPSSFILAVRCSFLPPLGGRRSRFLFFLLETCQSGETRKNLGIGLATSAQFNARPPVVDRICDSQRAARGKESGAIKGVGGRLYVPGGEEGRGVGEKEKKRCIEL